MTTDHETIDPELERTLREIRELPEPKFAADLDQRVAAGFGGTRAGKPSFGSRLKAWLHRATPRLAGAGAIGLTCIVLVAAISAIPSGSDDEAQSGDVALSGGDASAGGDAPASSVGRGDAAVATDGARRTTGEELSDDLSGSSGIPSTVGPPPTAPTGPFAADQNRRFIERSAQLTLGTDPEGVREAADEIFGIVGRYEGIVISSSIQDGPEGEAGARFELMIPSAQLSDALADLSGVAEVRSREEQTLDITAPTVTTAEKLQDARAEVEGLLKQLAEADTDEERFAVKQQLAFQRQRVANLRSTLSRLERRANLSRVSLDVVTGDAATFPGPATDDEWTIGDAVDDAGRVLSTAAGVTLVALAVLAPFALIALLAWLARRAWVRQGRERALEA